MQIETIELKEFGVWNGLRLAELSPYLTVIHGANEIGKTTLVDFLRMQMFGADTGRERYFTTDRDRAAGQIAWRDKQRTLLLSRTWRRDGSAWHEESAWREAESKRPTSPPAVFTRVDERLFRSVFCLDLSELHDLSRLDETQAAELLYSLSISLDRVSLFTLLRQLRADRQRWQSLSGEQDTSAARTMFERTSTEESQAESEGTTWLRKRRELAECDERAESLFRRATELDQQVELLDKAIQAWPVWNERAAIEADLSQWPVESEQVGNDLRRWSKLERARRKIKERLEALGKRRRAWRRQGESIVLRPRLWDHAPVIESLVDSIPRLIELEARLDSAPAAPEPAPAAAETESGEPQVTPAAWDILQQRGAAVVDAEDECQRLEEEVARREETLATARQAASNVVDPDELAARRAERDHLIHCRDLQQRLDRLTRDRKALRHETEELLEEQLLTPQVLAWLGVPFVIGVTLILGGIFWGTAAKLGWPIALLGLAGWIVAAVMKVMLERNAEQELAEARAQLEQLSRKIDETRAALEEAEETLPGDPAELEQRLAHLEAELGRQTRPDELTGMTVELDAVRRERDAARRRRNEAQRRWKEALARFGLPRDWSFDDLELVAIRDEEKTAPLPAQTNLAAERREYRLLQERVDRVLVELADETNWSDRAKARPVDVIHHLQAALVQERTHRTRRRRLVRRYRWAGRRVASLRRRLRRIHRARRSILQRLGARSPRELPRLKQRWHRFTELQQKLARLDETLRNVVDSTRWEAIESRLRNASLPQLTNERDAIERQREDTHGEYGRLCERRGELKAELKRLAERPAADTARFRRRAAQRVLAECVARGLAVEQVDAALRHLQSSYEKERQPATLAVASRYLAQITDEQYRRVWTPWDRNELLVETAAGEQRTVAQLSRGTREVLFLALRLAIVEHYADRQIRLPMILDDVLVNLDATRCRRTAQTLMRFAEAGHQVLLLTCHEHIVQAFASLDAPVISLDRNVRRPAARPSSRSAPPLVAPAPPPAPPAAPAASVPPQVESQRGRRTATPAAARPVKTAAMPHELPVAADWAPVPDPVVERTERAVDEPPESNRKTALARTTKRKKKKRQRQVESQVQDKRPERSLVEPADVEPVTDVTDATAVDRVFTWDSPERWSRPDRDEAA